MTHVVYLGLGSNVGNTKEHLNNAITLLRKALDSLAVAPWYLSSPVGYTDQADFLNTVVRGTTHLTPESLLLTIKDMEKELGRTYRFRWGPREIDIDILLYDQLVLEIETLRIPHPRMHEREFVLKPLADLDPHYMHPILNQSIANLLNSLPEKDHSIISLSQ